MPGNLNTTAAESQQTAWGISFGMCDGSHHLLFHFAPVFVMFRRTGDVQTLQCGSGSKKMAGNVNTTAAAEVPSVH